MRPNGSSLRSGIRHVDEMDFKRMNRSIFQDERRNAIRFSTFKKMEAEVTFTGIGLKYVATGEEVYHTQDGKFSVKAGEYIIGNDFTAAVVRIDHSAPVQGLCIDICPEIMAEVIDYHANQDVALKEFLLSDQFIVNRYHAQCTDLGSHLSSICQKISSGHFQRDVPNDELFYSLAEGVISAQGSFFHHFGKLKFRKRTTNVALLRLLFAAKEKLDTTLHECLALETICKEAGISKYHFIRLFREVFGVSPYQYHRCRRLERAGAELLKGRSVMETALQSGYSDSASFSKAFKQVFQANPKSRKKSNI